LWRWTKSGDFPIGYRLGPNAVAFDEAEILRWLAGRRVAQSQTATASSLHTDAAVDERTRKAGAR
jgi:hypothetical protein